MTNSLKVGVVHSVHPEQSAVKVTFAEEPNVISELLPVIMQHHTYALPSVNESVLCVLLPNSSNGFCLGTYNGPGEQVPITNDNQLWLENVIMNGSLGIREPGNQGSHAPYNFAVIKGERNGVQYTEIWILVNAWYDYTTKRFKRYNVNNFSFGWQLQGGGTYPGEETIGDFTNQGVNLWKANGKSAYGPHDQMRDQTGEDIGAPDGQGGWREFGIMLGWNNVFMCDSYGGMTIGGSGFEIDGSGMSPFKRVSLGKFSGGSVNPNRPVQDYVFAYNAELWNTQHGLWNKDVNDQPGYIYGMVAPINFYDTPDGSFNPYSNRADMKKAKFVVMQLPENQSHHVENWKYIVDIDPNGHTQIKGLDVPLTKPITVELNSSGAANVFYPDGSWNKSNSYILSVKGKLADGAIKPITSYDATYSDYGLYLAVPSGFTHATVLLSRIDL